MYEHIRQLILKVFLQKLPVFQKFIQDKQNFAQKVVSKPRLWGIKYSLTKKKTTRQQNQIKKPNHQHLEANVHLFLHHNRMKCCCSHTSPKFIIIYIYTHPRNYISVASFAKCYGIFPSSLAFSDHL